MKETYTEVQTGYMKNSFRAKEIVSSEMCLIKDEWGKLAGYGDLFFVIVDMLFWYVALMLVYFNFIVNTSSAVRMNYLIVTGIISVLVCGIRFFDAVNWKFKAANEEQTVFQKLLIAFAFVIYVMGHVINFWVQKDFAAQAAVIECAVLVLSACICTYKWKADIEYGDFKYIINAGRILTVGEVKADGGIVIVRNNDLDINLNFNKENFYLTNAGDVVWVKGRRLRKKSDVKGIVYIT